MTEDHLEAFVKAAGAKRDDDGWWRTASGGLVTVYVASNGASLTVSRIEALKSEGALVHAQTVRGELYILELDDIFAGAVEAAPSGSRKAGFV